MNKKRGFLIISFVLVFGFLYGQKKPSSSEVFEYYKACATDNVKEVQKFLEKYPDCVDIELFYDDLQLEDYNMAYINFANYLIATGIANGFKNPEEEKEWCTSYKRYPINIACRYGNINVVKQLIKYHANLELREDTGMTSLMSASKNGHLSVVKELLKQKVDPNSSVENNNWTALFYAIYYDQADIVSELLKNKADLNIKTINGFTPLLFSIGGGNIEIMRILLKNGANIDDKLNSKTALMFATESKNLDIVKEVLKYKVNINEQMTNGETALMYAADVENIDIVKELIKAGADVNLKTNYGTTALSVAIVNGNQQIVNYLMENDADLAGDFMTLISDFCLSLSNQQPEIACIILNNEKYSRMLFNSSTITTEITFTINDIKMTYLMCAAYYGYSDVVNLLIKKNVNINASNNEGITPLMLAAANNHKDIVNSLIKAGVDVNAKDYRGYSALMYACLPWNKFNDDTIVRILISNGAIYNNEF